MILGVRSDHHWRKSFPTLRLTSSVTRLKSRLFLLRSETGSLVSLNAWGHQSWVWAQRWQDRKAAQGKRPIPKCEIQPLPRCRTVNGALVVL